MKSRFRFVSIVAGSIGLVALSGQSLRAQASPGPTVTPAPTLAPTPSPPPCPRFGWAEGMSQYLKPAAPFPTDDTKNNPTTDCVFHQWSWEAFVWATAFVPANSTQADAPQTAPRFLTLPSLDALGQEAARPELAKVGPKPLVLHPRTVKPRGSQQEATGITQAGSEGILIDQNGQAVYYSQHANPLYFNLVQKYYGVANYQKASPTLQFPVGAAVFKASWHVVPDGSDASAFYTTKAMVPMLINNAAGFAEIDPSGKMREVTVALVGLHVVGVTDHHPEFLWATFEQLQNAPDFLPKNDLNGPVSDKNFTFYKANTLPADCNMKPAKESVSDPVKQTLTPITNVFRQFPFGGENATGMQEIEAINGQAQGAVKSFKDAPAEAVWANYRLIGTVWIKPDILQPGDGDLDTEAIGSVNLADATMESFVQGKGTNCFSCHSTGGDSTAGLPGKDINLSHKLLEPFFSNAANQAAKKK